MNKINLAPARKLIEEFEGLRLKAYLDAVKIPTIGYGTTRYPDGSKVRLGDTCTESEANQWLDLFIVKKIFPILLPAISVDITNNQFCALVSLAYNLGPTGAKNSKVVKALNAGRPVIEAADGFLFHNRAGGKVLRGLTRRRKAERELFLKA